MRRHDGARRCRAAAAYGDRLRFDNMAKPRQHQPSDFHASAPSVMMRAAGRRRRAAAASVESRRRASHDGAIAARRAPPPRVSAGRATICDGSMRKSHAGRACTPPAHTTAFIEQSHGFFFRCFRHGEARRTARRGDTTS